MTEETKYPFIECDAHPGEREPGYMVCRHVMWEAAEVIHLDRATPVDLGVICCQVCHEHREDSLYLENNFVISCAASMRERGLLASA
jgi:hypothetical protein